jgi:hypothetical protein
MKSLSANEGEGQEPLIKAQEVMEYLAAKSQTNEGLMKHNSFYPLYGYVGLSHTYSGEFQYYLHLELIKENYLEEAFILAREGVTING